MYDSTQLHVKVTSRGLLILGGYKPSGQWTITEASAASTVMKQQDYPTSFSAATFTLTLQKNEEESKEQ